MGLIELIITVCAVAQPGICEDQHLQLAEVGSPRQCTMAAMPYIAMSLVILVAIFFFPAIATWLPAVLGGR